MGSESPLLAWPEQAGIQRLDRTLLGSALTEVPSEQHPAKVQQWAQSVKQPAWQSQQKPSVHKVPGHERSSVALLTLHLS